MMPIDLVLVRHGESEGNIAAHFSYQGDHSLYTEEFKRRHSSLWRLTDKGREQAEIAGMWIRANIGSHFGRYYSSDYLRAIETAGNLELPAARWYTDFNLRERDHGYLDSVSQEERKILYEKDLALLERDGFYGAPPGWNSESMAGLYVRAYRGPIDTLHRECSNMAVIMVLHGEVMWTYRIGLERMPLEHYNLMRKSENPCDKMHNCQILHYTRLLPFTSALYPHFQFMRSACPWDMTISSNEWREIKRVTYSNEDLLARVAQFPRLINQKRAE